MRQALHIFKKDVQHLKLDILIVLAAVAGFTFAVANAASPMSTAEGAPGVALAMLTCLVLLTWWALIARLIHDEPLAVEQPFWITRPYSRGSLLAAKTLFIAVFVILPKFAGDALILFTHGFKIQTELGGLLWTQVLLTALFVLPVAALCTVTTGFVQLLITISVVGLAAAGATPTFQGARQGAAGADSLSYVRRDSWYQSRVRRRPSSKLNCGAWPRSRTAAVVSASEWRTSPARGGP